MSTIVTVDTSGAQAKLNELGAVVSPERRKALMRVLGRTVENRLRAHFRLKEAVPNKRGWPKQHFWARIARATNLTDFDSDAAIVSISDPAFALRYYGGTIRPRYAKALAIPLRREAYGVLPSSGLIPGLFVLKTARGAFLVAREAGFSKSGRQALRIYYKLQKSVTQEADKNALPEEGLLAVAVTREAEAFVARETKRINKP